MTGAAAILSRLRRASDGATVVEFAIVAPVFLILMMGTLDIGQMVYGKALLSGAVEAAARSSSLETANTAQADAMVTDRVKRVLPGVRVSSTRTSYFDFADIARAEQFDDVNGNGRCDNGEAYTDENANGDWDADIGVSGNGGAGDVVIYKVSATYKSTFKVPFMPSSWNARTLESTAIRKNQPFATQRGYSATAGTCT